MKRTHLITIGVSIILVSIPLTTLLFSRIQDLRKRAAGPNYILATRKLTTDPSIQNNPDVFGDQIVWEDWSVRNADIRGVRVNPENLEWERMELGLPAEDYGDRTPRVGERGIVWWFLGGYDDPDEGEIYFWRRDDGEIVNLSRNANQQWSPDIWDSSIVWEDWRNGNPDIYYFDLETNEELVISALPSYQRKPRIWKNIVLWRDNYQDAIYYFDLKTREEGFLDYQSYQFVQKNQDIADDIAVWQDNRNGNWDIYGYDFRTRRPFEVHVAPGNQINPSVSGNYVVWEDDFRGNRDIRGKNLLTQEVFDIAATGKDEVTPAISGQLVVWEEDPNGVSDIVLAKLKPSVPDVPEEFIQSLEAQFANEGVNLQWQADRNIPLRLAATGGDFSETVNLSPGAVGYSFSNLVNGQRYQFTLSALDDKGKELERKTVEEIPRCRLEDLNGNREVDIFDLVMVARRFGSNLEDNNFDSVVDLDKDGDIDLFDLVRVASAWRRGC